ncbi:hypothetical protein [Flavobacterium flavigenum]|uniref:hypothetical protein n=1 Tax=Flavobacterium flavigenum TaxID=3003258 RepID=UPI0022AC19C7|nr:hypothetical protein [Flavobacterium flavigenum]
MKNHLKYLISLFLALVMLACEGTLNSKTKSADYYQSSQIVAGRELDFKSFRLYRYTHTKSLAKTAFPILITFLRISEVFSFQTKELLRLCELLHQNSISFIKQSVFVNERITSGNFHTRLYSA